MFYAGVSFKGFELGGIVTSLTSYQGFLENEAYIEIRSFTLIETLFTHRTSGTEFFILFNAGFAKHVSTLHQARLFKNFQTNRTSEDALKILDFN